MFKRNMATRESFKIVPQTCPAIDSALSNISAAIEVADDLIKVQTTALREALTDALERAIELEKCCEKFEIKIQELENKISDIEPRLMY